MISRLKLGLLIIKETLRIRANMFKHLCSRHASDTRLSAGAKSMPRLTKKPRFDPRFARFLLSRQDVK